MREPTRTPADAGAASAEAQVGKLVTALNALEACQHNEARALAEGAVGDLERAIEHKRSALRDVQAFAEDPCLRALFEPAGSTRAQASAARLERTPSWPALLQQLERCRGMNEAAGGAIATAMRSTSYALRLLGHAPEPATYDAGGTPAIGGAGRDLAVC